jgi:hypothetical protein
MVALACALAPGSARADGVVEVKAIDGALIHFAETASASVDFPAGSWSKVEVVFRGKPIGDPWDRLFGVLVDGVEVLHGTTPRTDFTVARAITQYAPALSGARAVTAHLGTYVGEGQRVWVTFRFTPGAPPAGNTTSIDAPWGWSILSPPPVEPAPPPHLPDAPGIHSSKTIVAPSSAAAPSHVTFVAYLTGHNKDEDFFLNANPSPLRPFHLLLDGREIASGQAFPYTYAFVGSTGGEDNMQHQLMWWTAQRALNEQLHSTGVGAITPYTFDVTAPLAALAPGSSHTLAFVIDGGDDYWVFSGQLLYA